MKIEKKNLAKFVSLGIICFLLGAVYVYAQGSSQILTISQGVYPGAPSYTVWIYGSTYLAKNANGAIEFSSTSATTIVNSMLAGLSGTGGIILFEPGNYNFSTQIVIPTGTKNVEFKGSAGSLGKSYNTEGTVFTSSIAADSLLSITTVSDLRSAFGIHFNNIRFVGPGTESSVGLELNNLDGGEIHSCSFLNFGKSVTMDFDGSAYTISEQPGKLDIYSCEFGEGETSYIEMIKSTQMRIHDNIFESFGDFEDAIVITDSNKVYISHNEFDVATTEAGMTSYIRIISDAEGSYIPNGILISENWCYRESEEAAWILTYGPSKQMSTITSSNNMITHGYNVDPDADDGYIQIGDDDYHQITASDFVAPYSSTQSASQDKTATWTAGTTRRNLWSPVDVHLICTMPTGSQVNVFVYYNSTVIAGGSGILTYTTNANTQEVRALTFRVPTMHYWKVTVSGGATLTGVIAYYE